jgi:dienelactone hydrolase
MATIDIPASAGPMPVFDAAPSGEAQAVVVVVQEVFGVNAHIEEVADRLAAAGYRAVAPHLFHRTGDPVLPPVRRPPGGHVSRAETDRDRIARRPGRNPRLRCPPRASPLIASASWDSESADRSRCSPPRSDGWAP